ncbi:hypothetical protein BGX33_007598 [Mortierella sp. NVP41]|nr:hypothetical protein BGX33_007598 [Mortierella sp. NVP41]
MPTVCSTLGSGIGYIVMKGRPVKTSTYTSSKWMILPAKDLIRTRKDWKIAYGDRVWLVSYWYSTRNATMELPEYLPRARGGSCGHIVPYGEAFVICRTCPADVLCMQCFRGFSVLAASTHTITLDTMWSFNWQKKARVAAVRMVTRGEKT